MFKTKKIIHDISIGNFHKINVFKQETNYFNSKFLALNLFFPDTLGNMDVFIKSDAAISFAEYWNRLYDMTGTIGDYKELPLIETFLQIL